MSYYLDLLDYFLMTGLGLNFFFFLMFKRKILLGNRKVNRFYKTKKKLAFYVIITTLKRIEWGMGNDMSQEHHLTIITKIWFSSHKLL